MVRGKNGPLKAVALEYAPGDEAPRITAKGKGFVAEKIIQEAKANNVPIQDNELLVGILSHVDIDDEIPPYVYHAVAQVLTFVMRATRGLGPTYPPTPDPIPRQPK
ncbi:MAG: EscU/YscU/HrcU family type III secretion system export apparatus switch protein [Planctomycetota bacterium]|nr:EscU/YscU/HrcU family type III secretion system export apparatus switch protein [Planctomycetota bacterium]